MALLYQPPQNPYSGTENGSASNVFCNQIATASFIDGGPGFVIQAPATTYVATPGQNWGTTTVYTTAAIAPTTTTLAAGSAGAGLTATFAVTGSGANQTDAQVTVLISNPGSGYIVGDVLKWSDAAVETALLAALLSDGNVTSIAVSGSNSNPLVYTVALVNSGGVVTTAAAGQNGWQFSVNSIAALTQLVTITIPDNGIAGDDFADQDYVIVANITGGVAETATTTVGTITGSIFHHSDTNTEQITLRRVTGSAASTLLAGDVTVRLVKRMLPVV
jgi:hypothetical protein